MEVFQKRSSLLSSVGGSVFSLEVLTRLRGLLRPRWRPARGPPPKCLPGKSCGPWPEPGWNPPLSGYIRLDRRDGSFPLPPPGEWPRWGRPPPRPPPPPKGVGSGFRLPKPPPAPRPPAFPPLLGERRPALTHPPPPEPAPWPLLKESLIFCRIFATP